MTALTDFLLARIAEDEAAAQAAIERNGGEWVASDLDMDNWRIEGTTSFGNPRSYTDDRQLWDDEGAMGMWPETARHVTRHDPARVLAECAAYRQIVETCMTYLDEPDYTNTGGYDDTLRALASVYADHPEYDIAWRQS